MSAKRRLPLADPKTRRFFLGALTAASAVRVWGANEKVNVTAVSHPDSIYAGAIGAALWGAFRHVKLRELTERAAA